MGRVTYWVEYTIYFKRWDDEEEAWVDDTTFSGGKLNCSKKDIQREVSKEVMEMFSGEKVKDISFKITNYYPTLAKKIQRVLHWLLFPFALVFGIIGLLSAKIANGSIKAAGIRGRIEFIWFFE